MRLRSPRLCTTWCRLQQHILHPLDVHGWTDPSFQYSRYFCFLIYIYIYIYLSLSIYIYLHLYLYLYLDTSLSISRSISRSIYIWKMACEKNVMVSCTFGQRTHVNVHTLGFVVSVLGSDTFQLLMLKHFKLLVRAAISHG